MSAFTYIQMTLNIVINQQSAENNAQGKTVTCDEYSVPKQTDNILNAYIPVVY